MTRHRKLPLAAVLLAIAVACVPCSEALADKPRRENTARQAGERAISLDEAVARA